MVIALSIERPSEWRRQYLLSLSLAPQKLFEFTRLISVHPHAETQNHISTTTFLVRPSIAYVGTLTAEDLLQEVAECAEVPVRVIAYSNGMLPVWGDIQPAQAWMGNSIRPSLFGGL